MNFDFDIKGVEGLARDLQAVGRIPDAFKKELVDAEAKVVEEGIVYNAGTMLQGPYYEAGIAHSVTRRKPKITKNGAEAMIVFAGTQHGNRLGEIAFVNEYGKKNQAARPFIKNAIRDSADRAADAARALVHGRFDLHNL